MCKPITVYSTYVIQCACVFVCVCERVSVFLCCVPMGVCMYMHTNPCATCVNVLVRTYVYSVCICVEAVHLLWSLLDYIIGGVQSSIA